MDQGLDMLLRIFYKSKSSYKALSIPTDENIPTQRDFNKQQYKWAYRHIVEWYRDTSKADGTYNQTVESFLVDYCKLLSHQIDFSQYRALLPQAENICRSDGAPVLAYIAYANLRRFDSDDKDIDEQAEQIIRSAIQKLDQTKHPLFHTIMAERVLCRLLSKQSQGKNTEANRWQEKLTCSLADAIAVGEFRTDELRVAFEEIKTMPHSSDTLIMLVDKLKQQKNIDPWLLNMVAGLNDIELAWRWRGSGYAYEVTEDGWKGFRKHLAKADREFREAYRIRPEYPEAAANMITVAMAGSSSSAESERYWFDKAVAAQMDYPGAYNAYLSSIYPRWGGSHAVMYTFAQECLDTRRFDTDVPWYYLSTLRDIARESTHDRWKAVFRQPKVKADLKNLFAGVLNEPGQSLARNRILTQQAHVLLWEGNYEEAKKLLASVKPEVNLRYGFHDPISWNARDKDFIDSEINLFTGPYKATMQKAESINLQACGISLSTINTYVVPEILKGNIQRAITQFQELKTICEQNKTAQTVALYKQILAANTGNPAACRYLQEVIVATLFDNEEFAKGQGSELMHSVARRNQIDIAQYLLETGAGVDPVDNYGQTPLHWAAREGHTEMCQLLIKHGANINVMDKGGSTPLALAIDDNHPETAMLLLDNGAQADTIDLNDWSPLHRAVFRKQSQVALRLIDKGVKVNVANDQKFTPLYLAITSNQPDVAWKLIQKGADIDNTTREGWTPLLGALYYNQPEIAQWLIKHGANVHAVNSALVSALHIAIEKGQTEPARLLIESGSDINHRTADQLTPLHRASKSLPEIAYLLIDKGAAINTVNAEGWTPLDFALYYEHPDVALRLIQKGADISRPYPGIPDVSLLHFAAFKNYAEVVKAMLERGADPQAKDKSGKTPLDIARLKNNMEVVHILLAHIEKGGKD